MDCGWLDEKSAVESLLAPQEREIRVPVFEILKPELQLGEDIAVFTFNLNELDQDGAFNGWLESDRGLPANGRRMANYPFTLFSDRRDVAAG